MRPTVPRPSDPDDFEDRTYFHLVDSTGVRRGHVPGHLVLQDLRAGYVLLSMTEPWPQVVVVPAASVVAAMEEGDRRARD